MCHLLGYYFFIFFFVFIQQKYHNYFKCCFDFLQWMLTVTYMKRWGLWATSLSVVTKVGAWQKGSHKCLNPIIIYMLLAFVFNHLYQVYYLLVYLLLYRHSVSFH